MNSFCICKSYSHFFSKNTCELDILLTKTVNILTTYELVKLTMLCTTGLCLVMIKITLLTFYVKYLFQNRLYVHDLSSGSKLSQLPLEVGTIVGYSGKKKDTEVGFLLTLCIHYLYYSLGNAGLHSIVCSMSSCRSRGH